MDEDAGSEVFVPRVSLFWVELEEAVSVCHSLTASNRLKWWTTDHLMTSDVNYLIEVIACSCVTKCLSKSYIFYLGWDWVYSVNHGVHTRAWRFLADQKKDLQLYWMATWWHLEAGYFPLDLLRAGKDHDCGLFTTSIGAHCFCSCCCIQYKWFRHWG